ncbi:ABC transporter permease [Streptomyces sp. NPDC051018]|uniref:ABC transporter permease n=1 Tax=Streptomyces sp. NPDC051018 TaxID=3365639 RepID=UPI00378BFD32
MSSARACRTPSTTALQRRGDGTVLRLILLRVLQAIPLILLSTVVIFIAVSVAGDPLDQYRKPNVPQSTLDAKAAELGLDRPLYERYWDWISGAVQGDLGRNLRGDEVTTMLAERSLVSFRLIALAVVIAVVVALAVGFYSAVHRGSRRDRVLMGLTVVFLTVPEFWLAVVLKQGGIIFNRETGSKFIATVGDSTPGIDSAGLGERLSDYAGHLVLPTIVLVLACYPIWAMYQRTAMLEVLDTDYIRLARAKGLPKNTVLVRHGLRTALTPVVTMIALRLPWIIGGLVVVETVFGWRGLGQMLVEGIQRQDTNTVLGFLLFSAILITLLNLLADILYGYLDPRVRDD